MTGSRLVIPEPLFTQLLPIREYPQREGIYVQDVQGVWSQVIPDPPNQVGDHPLIAVFNRRSSLYHHDITLFDDVFSLEERDLKIAITQLFKAAFSNAHAFLHPYALRDGNLADMILDTMERKWVSHVLRVPSSIHPQDWIMEHVLYAPELTYLGKLHPLVPLQVV